MNIEAKLYGDFMDKYFRRGRARGWTQADTAEEYYGFHYNHVQTVHFHKQGDGEGIWFRLHDGRVFDVLGHPELETDPIWYDRRAN